MKINIIGAIETIADQFFDYFYAYQQSLDQSDYACKIEISLDSAPSPGCINILLIYVGGEIVYEDLKKFDLILLDNGCEPLETAGAAWVDLLHEYPNAYLLSGGYLGKKHRLSDRVISYNHNLTWFTDSMTRPFYPHHFSLKKSINFDKKNMIFINGTNRAWRAYFLDLLKGSVMPDIDLRNVVKSKPSKVLDCQFESSHDTEFREWINTYIVNEDVQQINNLDNRMRIPIGRNEKFGRMYPGFILIDEYFQYQCIVYPETPWINNQLMMTEKTWKCCLAGTIPWPISGANFHRLMNERGFRTAIDLLPDNYKKFDSIEDHKERYRAQVAAIKYASMHPEIWNSERAINIREQNFRKLWINDINLIGLQKFEKILKRV